MRLNWGDRGKFGWRGIVENFEFGWDVGFLQRFWFLFVTERRYIDDVLASTRQHKTFCFVGLRVLKQWELLRHGGRFALDPRCN